MTSISTQRELTRLSEICARAQEILDAHEIVVSFRQAIDTFVGQRINRPVSEMGWIELRRPHQRNWEGERGRTTRPYPFGAAQIGHAFVMKLGLERVLDDGDLAAMHVLAHEYISIVENQ